MAERSMLIVSHTFPPAAGIGGRRWAKFAKYLDRAGVRVHVLSANLPGTDSPWAEDAAGISAERYDHRFPEVLTRSPRSLSEKIKYRVALLQNRMWSDGTPYDRALYDEVAFLKALKEQMVREKPDTVFITAAPFRLPWYALKLRGLFPEVKFVADFRDPWTSGVTFGYGNLSPKRKKFEEAAEAAVIAGFDLITTPWETLAEELARKYPESADRIQVLPHCYDPDEVVRSPGTSVSEHTRIVYGGNLYQGLEPFYRTLSDGAAEGAFEVDLWSPDVPKAVAALAHDRFRILPPVASRAFFAEAARADWLLYPIPSLLRNGSPTKLFEYAATGVPLLSFGAEGSLSETITGRGLGIFLTEAETADNLRRIVTSPPDLQPDTAWIEAREAGNVTRNLIKMTAFDHVRKEK